MKESGWLTRSLEQNYAYDLRYRGKIRNKEVKQAFLRLLDNIESKGKSAKLYLIYLFKASLAEKDLQQVILVKPIGKDSRMSIEDIIHLLWEHFDSSYSGRGASRLPALAIYSIYQCIIKELKRFDGKALKSLEEHTSADCRSGYIGDIAVVNKDGSFTEGVEVKHKIFITVGMVKDVFEKIKHTTSSRFYVLTTAEPSTREPDEVRKLVTAIREKHGCQIIVNGIMPTLKYYLRLISNPDDFLAYYLDNIQKDSCIRKEHKERWNELLRELLSHKDE